VVVVDNPDVDVPALAERLGNPAKLRLIPNEARLGLTRSLNKAIAQSDGEILIRNDDDDVPEPGRATEIVRFLEAHPECDIVFSYGQGVDLPTGRTWIIGGPTTDEEIKKALAKRNFIVHSALAFRRTSSQRIGHYNETFRYAQDYEFYLRAIRNNLRFGAIPKMLVTRNYHGESITVSKRKRQILFSFAARLIHHAEMDRTVMPWWTIANYMRLLLIPNWLRAARRRLGYGR
jgi:glycosyltransferase involved in cell wall biosynthesis